VIDREWVVQNYTLQTREMPANHAARNQWNAQVLGSTMVKVWHLYIAWFSKAPLGVVVETSCPERLTPEECAENEP